MDKTRIQYLLQQQAADHLTEKELEELGQLLAGNNRETVLQAVAEFIHQESGNTVLVSQELKMDTFNKVISSDLGNAAIHLKPERPVHRVHFLRRWGWVAASIVLLLAAGAYLWFQQKPAQPDITQTQKIMDVGPGKDGAILTLADGRQVVLDSLGNGIIAEQSGVQVVLSDGKLIYDSTKNTPGAIVYNMLSTPKGRQFHIQLPDGTEVWLNAASSIRYPTAFAGKERKVEITGEAYFEVAKNAARPFIVDIGSGSAIEVLGTHFNINSYQDEGAIKTTLLEGSVRVESAIGNRQSAILKPGQQARLSISSKSSQIMVQTADIAQVMAWKNGLFNFEGVTLTEVMKQLERWYDIEVIYEKGVPDIQFGGELKRNVSLTSLIKGLEESEVHFKLVAGKKLIVLP